LGGPGVEIILLLCNLRVFLSNWTCKLLQNGARAGAKCAACPVHALFYCLQGELLCHSANNVVRKGSNQQAQIGLAVVYLYFLSVLQKTTNRKAVKGKKQ